MTGTAAQTSANEQDFTSSDSSNLSLTVKKPIYDGGLADAETSAALLVVERARIGLAQAEQAVLQEHFRPMSIWSRRVIVSFWKRPM